MQFSSRTRAALEPNLGELWLSTSDTREDTANAFGLVWSVVETEADLVAFLVDHNDMPNDKAEVAISLWYQGKIEAALDVLMDQPLAEGEVRA